MCSLPIHPNLNLFDVQTLSEYLQFSRYLMWSALRTYGGIGLFGLVLSAIGLARVTRLRSGATPPRDWNSHGARGA